MTTATLPRITTRVDADTQRLLQDAAALSGISSINTFVLHAAVEKAKQILEREQQLQLSERDAKHLIDYLDQPVEAIAPLQEAAHRYQQTR
ncbi:DUF1778 domain-containing protein [Magnetovirga frankeli]|jgi:uncharacterized protein (DUF1778 family)|uniref:type II toxin-antitoxin system TacA family antitoxin n=1 Tax=Magnetovirga frankeli TaxID=947516 RepID=UPI00129353E4|nr:DUF1778 domain-containing protein [gamma proteobacterium SS-5]